MTFIIFPLKVNAQSSEVVCPGAARMYTVVPNPGSTYSWIVVGDSVTYQYGDSIEVIWGSQAGSHSVQVIEKSSFGCFGVPVTINVQISIPSLNLGGEVKICEGQSATLDVNKQYPVYAWSTGETTQSIKVKASGYYKVEVIDNSGCHASDSVLVSLAPTPKVNLGPDTMLCDEESMQLDAGNDGYKYLWSDNSTSQTSTVGASAQYVWAQVTSIDGCVATDTMLIITCDYSKFINEIPNTITPNGDGRNDTWQIGFLEHFPNATVQVYDRWGQLVFQSNHGLSKDGWDGTSSGRKLPMDSYFYILNLKEGHAPLTGTISIVR